MYLIIKIEIKYFRINIENSINKNIIFNKQENDYNLTPIVKNII